MSGEAEQAISMAVRVLVGDKIGAEHQRKLTDVLIRVQSGELTEQQAIDLIRPKLGDNLDKELGNA